MKMGNLDSESAREIANLEAQKRHLEMQIRRKKENALSRNVYPKLGNHWTGNKERRDKGDCAPIYFFGSFPIS